MAAREFKTRLVLDGEKEYQSGMNAAYEEVKRLGRQVKVAEAAFIDNADSMEANAAKAKALRKQIEAQQNLIKSLGEHLKSVEGKYEGTTEAEEHYAARLVAAKKALTRMQGELDKAESAMDSLEKGTDQGAQKMERFADSAKDAGRGAEDAAQSVGRLKDGFTVVRGVVSNLASDALRKGAGALRDFAEDGVTLASDLQEVDNVVQTAFGGQSAAMKAWADTADTQFGLSALAAQRYAGTFGAALNALGLEDTAPEMSKTLTGLAGDLASFWNITADEAYGKVFSGVISGETEGLKALGIVMTDANLQAFALEEGIKKKTSAMTADEKAMLRYRYVLAQTEQAQGDFAKTSGSFANQRRMMRLSGENLRAELGNKLLPTLVKIIGKVNEFANSDKAREMIENIGAALGELIENGLTALGSALAFVATHLDLIKGLAAAILGGMAASKLTGMVMSIVKLAQGLRLAATGAASFSAALNINPIMLAVTAIAALTSGLIALSQTSGKVEIELEVPEDSKNAITDGINAGIEAAEKGYAIKVTVDADTSAMSAQLEDIFSDGKVTSREYRAATKYVKDVVAPDIKEAKKQLAKQKEEFKQSLLSIVGPDGMPAYTEEEAESASSAISTQTRDMITELETAYNDYNSLFKAIYNGDVDASKENIAQLEALLERIGVLRGEIKAAQDDALLVQKAMYNRALQGHGTEQDFGAAIGYVQGMADNALADAKSQYTAQVAELQRIVDSSASTEEVEKAQETIDKLSDKYNSDTGTILDSQQQQLEDLFAGYAQKEPEAAAGLEAYAKLLETAAQVNEAYTGSGDIREKAKAILTPENLANFFPEFTQSDVERALETGEYGWVESIVDAVHANIEDELKDQKGTLEDNPIMAWLSAMLDSGALQELDLSSLSGVLGDAVTSAAFAGALETAGGKIWEGIDKGVMTGAEDESYAEMKDSILSNMEKALDIHSPAKSMYPIGEEITAGVLERVENPDEGKLRRATAALRKKLLRALYGRGDDAGAADEEYGDTLMDRVLEDIDAGMPRARRALLTSGREMLEAINRGMRSQSYGPARTVRAIAEQAAEAAGGYKSRFAMAGKEMIQGLIDGMGSMQTELLASIRLMMERLIDQAKRTLDTSSASRAATYDLDVAERARATQSAVSRAMDAAATSAAPRAVSRATVPARDTREIIITQNVYANQTSYAAQQREAARQFAKIARALG